MLKALKYKQLSQNISDKKGIDKELLDSMIIDVFFDLREKMTSFEELRYSIRGLFIFFYRKCKLEKMSSRLSMIEDGTINPDDIAFKSFLYNQEPSKIRQKLDWILDRYNHYIKTKDEIREHNYKARKASKNNLV